MITNPFYAQMGPGGVDYSLNIQMDLLSCVCTDQWHKLLSVRILWIMSADTMVLPNYIRYDAIVFLKGCTRKKSFYLLI